jgi:hypothetical protein
MRCRFFLSLKPNFVKKLFTCFQVRVVWPTSLSVLKSFFMVCEPIGTAATPGLLCQPRVIVKMIVEKQMELRLAGETEVLGENLAQRHFCPSQNPTWPDTGLNPGRRGGKPATNRLSYGAAVLQSYKAPNQSDWWALIFARNLFAGVH